MRTTPTAMLVLAASILLPAPCALGAQAARHAGRAVGMSPPSSAPAATEPARREPGVPLLVPPAPPAMPAPVMLTGITSYTILADGRARADFGGAERLLHRCPSSYLSYLVYYGRPWDPPASPLDRPPVQALPMSVATRPSNGDPRIGLAGPGKSPAERDAPPVYVVVGTMCYYLDPAGRFIVLRF